MAFEAGDLGSNPSGPVHSFIIALQFVLLSVSGLWFRKMLLHVLAGRYEKRGKNSPYRKDEQDIPDESVIQGENVSKWNPYGHKGNAYTGSLYSSKHTAVLLSNYLELICHSASHKYWSGCRECQ